MLINLDTKEMKNQNCNDILLSNNLNELINNSRKISVVDTEEKNNQIYIGLECKLINPEWKNGSFLKLLEMKLLYFPTTEL